jgi:hypothetical protein
VLKTYHGSCHCGAVRFEAEIDLTQPTYRCNCSICSRNRFWAAVVKPGAFRLLEGKTEVKQYLFNSMQNEHFFCKTCGVRAYGLGNSPDVGEMVGVNIGCLEDATPEELAAAPIRYCDGKYDNWQNEPAITSYLRRLFPDVDGQAHEERGASPEFGREVELAAVTLDHHVA